MTEKETLEAYERIDKEMRETAIAILFSLSLKKAEKRIKELALKMRGGLPDWVDWFALAIGMSAGYISFARRLSELVDMLGENANSENLLEWAKKHDKETYEKIIETLFDLGDFESFSKKEDKTKVDAWTDVQNAYDHHEKYERLRDELGENDKGMVDLFEDWAEKPKQGGLIKTPKKETKEDKGDLFYTTIHKGSSTRCFPDQLKIVSKSKEATSGLWTGEMVDGHKVYSLKAMVARVDKYGWHNFILTGFNCKHHLKRYEGELPTDEEEAEVDEIDHIMSAMERKLRKLWRTHMVFEKIDKQVSERYLKKWKRGYREYLAYAKKHGAVPSKWRCQ